MSRIARLVIEGGLVVDGRGGTPVRADVLVEGGRIAAIGRGFNGAPRLDARGRTVLPGFIDVHTHSDFTLPIRPAAEAKLLQGVTTDVTGNCGFSPFPLDAGDPQSRRHGVFFEPALDERWATVGAFADDLEGERPGINIVPLLGLGAARVATMGMDSRPPTAGESHAMRELVRRTLRDGAFGVSSGLVYAPSAYAEVAELADLARVTGEEGGIYCSHLRDEGDALDAAVEEAIEIGRRGDCPVHISHHKAFGRRNWGAVERTLRRIDEVRAEGQQVTLDAYPYTYGSSTLASLLPAQEMAEGDAALRARLHDPAERERTARAVVARDHLPLEDVILAAVPSGPELAGRTLGELGRRAGVEPVDVMLDVLRDNGLDAVALIPGIDEQDVVRVLSHPQCLCGSDGWIMATDAERYAHPRNFASAVRFITELVRRRRAVTLGQAAWKLAGGPARLLGLRDRGVLAPGAVADVVVLDLERLRDGASYAEPCVTPEGIEHVLVNGIAAVEDGQPTGAREGRVLRRVAR